MSDTNERSVASDGYVQPLAWAVACPTGEPLTVRWTWHECLDVAGPADEIIPLYRQQKPPLTDSEREAISTTVSMLVNKATEYDLAAAKAHRAIYKELYAKKSDNLRLITDKLRGLLERL